MSYEEIDTLFTNRENPNWEGVDPEAAFHAKRALKHMCGAVHVLFQQAGVNDDDVDFTDEEVMHLNTAAHDVANATVHGIFAMLNGKHAHNPDWVNQTP